jgi:hypothetical protein
VSPRPAASLLVSALVRAVEAAGGGAMVLAKGDATAGAILLATAERGRATGLYERTLGPAGRYGWTATGPPVGDATALGDYIARRRRADPDQWVVELDHAQALAIASAMLGDG